MSLGDSDHTNGDVFPPWNSARPWEAARFWFTRKPGGTSRALRWMTAARVRVASPTIPSESTTEHAQEDRMRQVADRERGQVCVWAGSTREVCGGDTRLYLDDRRSHSSAVGSRGQRATRTPCRGRVPGCETCGMWPSGDTGWRANQDFLYCFCNFLWAYHYFRIKS